MEGEANEMSVVLPMFTWEGGERSNEIPERPQLALKRLLWAEDDGDGEELPIN